jgi:hypothetical protein
MSRIRREQPGIEQVPNHPTIIGGSNRRLRLLLQTSLSSEIKSSLALRTGHFFCEGAHLLFTPQCCNGNMLLQPQDLGLCESNFTVCFPTS